MKFLSPENLKALKKLMTLTQDELKSFMTKYLKTKYKRVINTKDYICAEGDIPIALTAHLDTVFKITPRDFFYDSKKNVLWSPQGLGADDRAGVFSIILLLQTDLRPHIILTTDEEVGGIGAYVLAGKNYPFKELNYIIELDRRGTDDCVFYDCDNKDFIKYIEKFGFVENFGSFSDISILCPAWKVAGVNLSIGYRNEHSFTELLYIGDMLETIEKVKIMLSEKDIPYFEYIENPFYKMWEYQHSKNFDEFKVICKNCHQSYPIDQTFKVKTLDGGSAFYCEGCLENIGWCSICDKTFEIGPDGDSLLCKDCREREARKNNYEF